MSTLADVSVGRELGDPMGWLIRRTKRVEELLAVPEVMQMADRLATYMERYAESEHVPVKDLDVGVLPTQTKTYITIYFGAHECMMCEGTGHVAMGQYCPVCQGAGNL